MFNIKLKETTDLLLKYNSEIMEIAMFAKRINYNIENGIEELTRLWLQDGLKFQMFVEDNKQEFMCVTKQFI